MSLKLSKSCRPNLVLFLCLITFACGTGSQQNTNLAEATTSTKLNFAARIDIDTWGNMDTGGFHSGSLAVGDFNGDGFSDIAVSNEMSNTISVFLNDGKGHFSNPIITPAQISALNVGPIAAGDLNEDGRTDLVLGTIGGSQANMALLSNGDGTFTQQPPISNSFGFLRARLVDLNGDKHLDLVAGGNGNMAVALGNGDGTFSSMTYLDNGPAPDSYDGIDIGDVNGDGKLDIIGLNFTPDDGDIVIFLGNGNGTFQSPISQTSVNSAVGSVSAADFNDDGKLDLLVGSNPGSVLLFNGNGDGTFSLNGGITTDFSLQGTGSSVLAADMNKDGKPEALYANYTNGVFSIFLNSTSGFSTAQFTETIAPGLSDIGTADFNGDGKPDVVLVNCQTNTVSVILTQ